MILKRLSNLQSGYLLMSIMNTIICIQDQLQQNQYWNGFQYTKNSAVCLNLPASVVGMRDGGGEWVPCVKWSSKVTSRAANQQSPQSSLLLPRSWAECVLAVEDTGRCCCCWCCWCWCDAGVEGPGHARRTSSTLCASVCVCVAVSCHCCAFIYKRSCYVADYGCWGEAG